MNDILPIIILIIIIIIGFKVYNKNYNNRDTYINSSLIEFCYEIITEYDKISMDKQHELNQTLSPKELELLNRLIIRNDNLGSNLNVLQTQMFTLESIMKKIRNFAA